MTPARPKLFVVDYQGYGDPFLPTFDLTEDRDEADAIMLTGGEDVSPCLYGEPQSRRCYTNPRREVYELSNIEFAKEKNLPIIGICRGAQFLCVANGGKLVQDVSGHGRGHVIRTIHDGTDYLKRFSPDQPLRTSSLHHQMMRPEGTDHTMIGWAERISSRYLNGNDEEIYGHALDKEPEVVVFNKVRGIGIQGHPEMMRKDDPFVLYCNQLVKDYLL